MAQNPVNFSAVLSQSGHLQTLLEQVRANRLLTAQVRQKLPQTLAAALVSALYEEDSLVLFARSPAWAARLRFMAAQIREWFPAVQTVRVKVLIDLGEKIAPPVVPQVLTANAAAHIRASAAAMTDMELQAALLRLAAHGQPPTSEGS